MRLARDRALTHTYYQQSYPCVFYSRNEVSPRQGIDTKLLEVLLLLKIIVEMRLARDRALTLFPTNHYEGICFGRNEVSPRQGIDTVKISKTGQ